MTETERPVAGWLEAEGWEVRLQPVAEHFVHIDVVVAMLGPKLAAVCLEVAEEGLVAWLRSKAIELSPSPTGTR